MEQQKVDMWILSNKKYFEDNKIAYIRERLLQVPDDKYSLLVSVSFQDPTIVLILSIFLGGYGVDRFMIGDIGMGVLKLLTGGLCGILTIIDWFTISSKVKEQNFEKLASLI